MTEATHSLHSLIAWAAPALLRTFVGAALIVALAGTARSVGFMIGLEPDSSLRMRRSRVAIDIVVAVCLVWTAARLLVKDGAVDLGELSGVNLVLPAPWSLLVPAGLSLMWLRAVTRSHEQAYKQRRAPKGDQILIVRSLFNPDEVFAQWSAHRGHARRTVDQWLLSEMHGLWSLVVKVFAMQMAELLTARNDVLSGVHPDRGVTRTNHQPGWSKVTSDGYTDYADVSVHSSEAGSQVEIWRRGFPLGALCLTWGWAFWRLPGLIGLPFATQPRVIGFRDFLRLDQQRTLANWLSWLPQVGSGLGLMDLAVGIVAVLLILRREGSLLVGISLVAVGVTSLGTVLAPAVVQTELPLWKVISVVPLAVVAIRLATVGTYVAPAGWWQPRIQASAAWNPTLRVRKSLNGSGLFFEIMIAIVVAIVLTLIASFAAQYSFAMSTTGDADPSLAGFRLALQALSPYAAWALVYVVAIDLTFKATTNLTVNPLNDATPWALGVLIFGGVVVLSFLAPHLVQDGAHGIRAQYISDPRPAIDSYPTPEAWMCGPMLFAVAYTVAAGSLLLKPLGRYQAQTPTPIRIEHQPGTQRNRAEQRTDGRTF